MIFSTVEGLSRWAFVAAFPCPVPPSIAFPLLNSAIKLTVFSTSEDIAVKLSKIRPTPSV